MRKLSSFTKNDNLTIKTTTIMTQVKLFEQGFGDDIENRVNQFLQEKANSIKVIDIKYTTPVRSEARNWKWTVMVIYETL